MPERITWSVVFILEASELIRSQCAYASRCGVQKTEMLRPERGTVIVRHVIYSAALALVCPPTRRPRP